MPRLISLSYSPWSEKARWALDHHGIAYDETEYMPMLGEPGLRFVTRRFTGKVTVPVYLDGDAVLGDSLDIARHAERIGRGTPLFPAKHEAAIREWSARSEEALAAARAIVLAKTLASDDAKRELLPKRLRALGLAPMAAVGLSFVARKYAAPIEQIDAQRAIVRSVLVLLRSALGGKHHVVGDALTYADIAMAAAVQIVKPVDDRFIRLKPATRLCWTDDALAAELTDIVAWRDTLYDAHRRASV